jgi:hypothetical protein
MEQTTLYSKKLGALGAMAAIVGIALTGTAAMSQSPYDSAQQGSSFTVTHWVTAGTPVKVIIIDPISTSNNQVGDPVRMRVAPDDTSGVPKTVIFVGHIRHLTPANNNEGGDLGIRFDGIETVGNWQPSAPPSQNAPVPEATLHLNGADGAKGNPNDVAIGAGAGAIIGGSRKRKLGDAVEGGILGALGGLLVQKATTHSGVDINLKPGDETTITLKRPITLKTEMVAS